ncbi:peptidase [Bifidobacterium dentium]|uniref:peptidase n=1 Tax=Bifidobacterium dentium TaxID=1689 RepID=UPI00080B5B4B|nr:peptidase [Bifidobacterium dentium]
MNAMKQRSLAILVSMVLALIMVVAAGCPTAQAAQLEKARAGTYYPYTLDGREYTIGVSARGAQGHNYYCRQIAMETDYITTDSVVMASDDTSRRLAWLINGNRLKTDALLHAAIGVLVHRAYDDQTVWGRHETYLFGIYAGLEQKVNELWKEAAANVCDSMVVTRENTKGLSEGDVNIMARNANGDSLAGIRFTAVISGPAVFDNDKAKVTGVTAKEAQRLHWKATGSGGVNVQVTYKRLALEQATTAQQMVTFDDQTQYSADLLTFDVVMPTHPRISTTVASKQVDAGQEVRDTVRLDMPEGQTWPEGAAYQATGWYFDGLEGERLGQRIVPDDGEDAQTFIARLAVAGYTPSAYGSITLNAQQPQREALAVTQPSGSTAYAARGDGGFGTWVWAIECDLQTDAVKRTLEGDVVSAFLDAEETNVNRARLEVRSKADRQTATIGQEISDSITVSGFPDDHGTFSGNEDYGFGADTPYAQVSVWWAADDCEPDTHEEPEEDDNHRLIGTWDYPAVSGTFRVGDGEKDAHGNPVHISAQQSGWYVFVWKYEGDSRVGAATSSYADERERVRVVAADEMQMPKTGSSFMLALGIVVAALATGAFMLFAVQRR